MTQKDKHGRFYPVSNEFARRQKLALACPNWYRRGLAIRYGFLTSLQKERALIDPHPHVRSLAVSMGGLSLAQHLRALADSDWRVRKEAQFWITS